MNEEKKFTEHEMDDSELASVSGGFDTWAQYAIGDKFEGEGYRFEIIAVVDHDPLYGYLYQAKRQRWTGWVWEDNGMSKKWHNYLERYCTKTDW